MPQGQESSPAQSLALCLGLFRFSVILAIKGPKVGIQSALARRAKIF
jgi:hypothetical protein